MTGGTSGVGRSLLPKLAQAGFGVHFIGRDATRGHAIEAELNAAHGDVAHFVRLDLSDLGAVRDFARGFRHRVPELHLLANIAGRAAPPLATPG